MATALIPSGGSTRQKQTTPTTPTLAPSNRLAPPDTTPAPKATTPNNRLGTPSVTYITPKTTPTVPTTPTPVATPNNRLGTPTVAPPAVAPATGMRNVSGVESTTTNNGTPGGTPWVSPTDSINTGYSAQPSQTNTSQATTGQNDMSAQTVVDSVDTVMTNFQDTITEFKQYGVEGMAAIAAQWTQMETMLNNLEAQIMGQIKGQMGMDDPAMKSAIALIRDEVTMQKNSVLEELNARGLSQSGVVAEMLDRLNKGELTQVQQLVGNRVADLQNQLNTAVMSMAQLRISALGQNQASANAFMSANQDRIATMQTNLANLGMQGVGFANQYNIAKMGDDTQRYGIDVGAQSSKYNTDVGAQSSKYNADLDYKASTYGTDKSYAASMAGINASKNNNSGAGGLDSQYSMGTSVLSSQIAAAKKGTLTKQQVLEAINGSPYDAMVKQALINIANAELPDPVKKAKPKVNTPKVPVTGYPYGMNLGQ